MDIASPDTPDCSRSTKKKQFPARLGQWPFRPSAEYERWEASSYGESRQVGCAGWRLLTPLRAGPGRQNRLWRTPPVGRLHDVLEAISETQNTLQATGERWVEAELNRIAGEVALMLPEADATKAEIYFDRALAVARKQRAKSWELRASMSLARLWRDQGKVSEARELLAPVYGWFTEGFDTRDLKEAKALLEELAT